MGHCRIEKEKVKKKKLSRAIRGSVESHFVSVNHVHSADLSDLKKKKTKNKSTFLHVRYHMTGQM